MSWWRRNWRWLLAVGIACIGLAVLLILYVLRRKAEAEQLRAELALMKAGAKVEGLKAEKQARKLQLQQNDVERKKLDAEIIAAKRKAVATVKDVEEMSDTVVAIEFRKLGY